MKTMKKKKKNEILEEKNLIIYYTRRTKGWVVEDPGDVLQFLTGGKCKASLRR